MDSDLYPPGERKAVPRRAPSPPASPVPPHLAHVATGLPDPMAPLAPISPPSMACQPAVAEEVFRPAVRRTTRRRKPALIGLARLSTAIAIISVIVVLAVRQLDERGWDPTTAIAARHANA